jgi:hypothetical protein
MRSRGERGPGIKCSYCGEIGHHNARTCPRRQALQRQEEENIELTVLPPQVPEQDATQFNMHNDSVSI